MKRLVMVLAIVGVASAVHGLIYLNGTPPVFDKSTNRALISNGVATGAAHFLLSKSAADALAAELEMGALRPVDLDNARRLVRQAIDELELARDNFQAIQIVSEKTTYSAEMRRRLREFDYDTFVGKRGLNPQIAAEVCAYLQHGDMRGLYWHNVARLEQILETLEAIEALLAISEVPETDLVWVMVQQYAETALFGNYAAVISEAVFGA